MKHLIISTKFADAVLLLLAEHDLIERYHMTDAIINKGFMAVKYPDDAISQELAFWFALAEGCGLVTGHRIDS